MLKIVLHKKILSAFLKSQLYVDLYPLKLGSMPVTAYFTKL